jgi:hypothetical protein
VRHAPAQARPKPTPVTPPSPNGDAARGNRRSRPTWRQRLKPGPLGSPQGPQKSRKPGPGFLGGMLVARGRNHVILASPGETWRRAVRSPNRRTRMIVGVAASALLSLAGCTDGSADPGRVSTSSVVASGSSALASASSQAVGPVEAVQMAANQTFHDGSFHADGGFEVVGGGQRIGFSSAADIDVDADAMEAIGTFESFPGFPLTPRPR